MTNSSNTNIQLTSLDFDTLKQNFIAYLQSQDVFQDYNFDGSVLSTLLDVLTLNTSYNAYYLNQVANEMFLDSAALRSSVVSHAKLLGYVPQSATAPSAFINFIANGVTSNTFTLPKYTNFMSQAINGVNYNFVTTDTSTIGVVNNVATLNNVELKQGISTTYTFPVDSTTNPNYIFEIPDSNIDVSTIEVIVQQSSTNLAFQIFNSADNYISLDSTSMVYFVQEATDGNYQIYFGDGVLGYQLQDGNIVIVSYISTSGTSASGANNFTLMDSVNGGTSYTIVPVSAASSGSNKESIDSIKFQAPKAFTSQNRAVTKSDYVTLLNQNSLGIGFDAVNVWGGEENNPPAYGQVFICAKPTGGYALTQTQKQAIINQVLTPYSVLTVSPTLIDPDYTFINLTVNTYYDPTQTNQTPQQLQSTIIAAATSYLTTSLNSFNSTFDSFGVLNSIQNSSQSIITCELDLKLEKRILPSFSSPITYNLYYNTELDRGIYASGVTSAPGLTFNSTQNLSNTISNVFIEEVPQLTTGVQSITILNPGFNYQSTPTITILGDGTGATAEATIVNGSIATVTITNSGSGYTSAIAIVTPAAGDTLGTLGSLSVSLIGQYGTLRTYYNNINNVKTILNPNIGTIDYTNGIITLNSFNPIDVNNSTGQLSVFANPTSTIISSTFNNLLTFDIYNPNAITINLIPKSSQ